MNKLSVVILSKKLTNFVTCAEAVRRYQPTDRIILVDDGTGIDPKTVRNLAPLLIVDGQKPFIFARNANIGIAAAGADDVVLLNDDAVLGVDGGFSAMQNAAEEHQDFGLIASTTNCVGNQNQYPRGVGLREDPRQVCFVCVLIPRRTVEKVGFLDERYTGYGLEDDDYCLRVRNEGMKLGIHDVCFVDHLSLPSSFRGRAGSGGNYLPNLEIFKKKWGFDNWGRKVRP